jgi:hypothetical protein
MNTLTDMRTITLVEYCNEYGTVKGETGGASALGIRIASLLLRLKNTVQGATRILLLYLFFAAF